MPIQQRLAESLLTRHPEQAAKALERFADDEIAAVLAASSPKIAAPVLCKLVQQRAAFALQALEPDERATILDEVDPRTAARLLRRFAREQRDETLSRVSSRHAAVIKRLLRFRENTAGALMDPLALTVAPELTAKEAIGYVRKAPEQARYNLYVVDREQRLIGVLNIRELFVARGQARVSTIMKTELHHLPARADRDAIVHHPGWREVHSLPVVDEKGVFVGVLRYRTFRRLETELIALNRKDLAPTAEALSDLFGAGVAALIGSIAPRSSEHGR